MIACLTLPIPVMELFVALDAQKYHFERAEADGKVVVKNKKGDVAIVYVDKDKRACITLRAAHDSI